MLAAYAPGGAMKKTDSLVCPTFLSVSTRQNWIHHSNTMGKLDQVWKAWHTRYGDLSPANSPCDMRPLMPLPKKNNAINSMVIRALDYRTYGARSAFSHLELWRKPYDCSLHHFATSQCILKCALLTFLSTTNWLAEIWKGDFSTSRFGRLVGRGGQGWAHPRARPWVPISSSLTHMVYLLPF